jgi:signal transduction histidine kinase
MDRLIARQRDRLAARRLDVILLSTAAGLAIVTLLILNDPLLSFALADRSLDVAITSLIVVVSVSLAAQTLARYRESGRVAGLFQCSAFLAIAWLAGLNAALVLFRVDFRFGLTLGAPEQLPLYVAALARITAAGLLVIGGMAAVGAIRPAPQVRRILFIPLIALTLITLGVYALREYNPSLIDLLPPLINQDGIEALVTTPRPPGALPGRTAIDLGIHLVSGGLFLAGVIFYRRSYLRNGPVGDGFLAVAMLLGAFAEVHSYFFPGAYSGLVTSAAALRLALFVVLMLGLNAEARADLRALRSAYDSLDRLRHSEAERATLEERTRLARELHDGLAQDLWFAKLKNERLVPLVPEEHRPLAIEVTSALDAALVEARQAVATMRAGSERAQPLHQLLAEAVEEFGRRSGVRADFSGADLPQELPPRTQAELLRVLQEALANIAKHADATVVRVAAESNGEAFSLSVIDNGRGFDPAAVTGDGMGVQGMRERARLMGGELQVTSEPSGGTHVLLRVPVANGVKEA